MLFILVLIGLIVFVTAMILPWVNLSNIAEMKERLADLEGRLVSLEYTGVKAAVREKPVDAPMPSPSRYEMPPVVEEAPVPEWKQMAKPYIKPVAKDSPVYVVDDVVDKRVKEKTPRKTFEQQFGGQAFVWMGGVALALAGFFLVKYSIESGLLTEQVRVILGFVFGFALLGGGYVVRQYPKLANGTRIAQALTGAGIADLYGSLFAATTLYRFLPSWLGFSGMAAVTAMTLVLSLRHGAPIAMLGLIGGFVTPMLVHGEPNVPLLFGYLYLVFGGFMVLARRQGWWGMSLLATLVSFLWVGGWLFNGMDTLDAVAMSMFLMAVNATTVIATHGSAAEDENGDLPSAIFSLRALGVGGSLLLAATVAGVAHFTALEWDMFGLFSVAAVALAWFDSRTYGFAPWLAMGANVVMLLAWGDVQPATLAVTLGLFGLLFIVSGCGLMVRTGYALRWAGMSAASAFAYYILAYIKLGHELPPILGVSMLSADEIWAVIAFVFALGFTSATNFMFTAQGNRQERHKLQAIFALLATTFLSFGFAFLLQVDALIFTLAAQILAVSWISTRADIPALRWIAQILTMVFGILLLPDIAALLASPIGDTHHHTNVETHRAISLLFRFGWPSIMLAGASWLLRAEKDDWFVGFLEVAAIFLCGAMVYDLIGILMPDSAMGFMSRSLFTNILLVMGLAAFRIGRDHSRPAVVGGGVALAGLALTRVGLYDLLIYNPVWSHQMVGTLPVVNGLLLAYALPALLIGLICGELARIKRVEFLQVSKIAAFILSFVFVSLNVRQFFHGAYLDVGAVSNAEIYTYSAVWLAYGIGLLVAGTMREDRAMRVTSLLVILLVVAKVFLYDTSELAGLWRAFSFFGLGMSLLGLSWYYSRYVFTGKK